MQFSIYRPKKINVALKCKWVVHSLNGYSKTVKTLNFFDIFTIREVLDNDIHQCSALSLISQIARNVFNVIPDLCRFFQFTQRDVNYQLPFHTYTMNYPFGKWVFNLMTRVKKKLLNDFVEIEVKVFLRGIFFFLWYPVSQIGF